MARPLRIAIPDLPYHVFSRGNDRQTVFCSPADRKLFLQTLSEVVERYAWLCHSYCLMDNHYHLLVETPRANLSLGMRQLNGLYARRFNLRYGRCGHVFQARFRSILVQRDSHLLRASRYIVLNPVRAGICAHPEEWAWSSYRATAGLERPPPFLCTELLLSRFGERRAEAQARYRAYVEEVSQTRSTRRCGASGSAKSTSCVSASATTRLSRRSRAHRSSPYERRSRRSSPLAPTPSRPPTESTDTRYAS